MAHSADEEQTTSEPALLLRLRSHFDGDPSKLPVVEQQCASYERANFQLARPNGAYTKYSPTCLRMRIRFLTGLFSWEMGKPGWIQFQ